MTGPSATPRPRYDHSDFARTWAARARLGWRVFRHGLPDVVVLYSEADQPPRVSVLYEGTTRNHDGTMRAHNGTFTVDWPDDPHAGIPDDADLVFLEQGHGGL